MKIIIIDDEFGAREILERLILSYHPSHEVVGKFEDLPKGVEGIKSLVPDLVFLDMMMPGYAGYEIVDFFDEINFKIVFVTAYNHFAITAFELSAIDYILKPIELERLQIAMTKVEESLAVDLYKTKLDALSNTLRKSEQKISYINKGYREYLLIEDIVSLEANGAYTKVFSTSKEPIIISKNIKRFEEEFEDFPSLMRVHRSWIINTDHIIKVSKSDFTVILVNDQKAKLSRKALKELFPA